MSTWASRIRSKIANADGETLVETLVSTLIIAAVMLALCTAIVTAAKVNAAIPVEKTTFDATAAQETPISVSIEHDPGMENSGPAPQVDGWSTENGYFFYEPK